MRYVCKDNTDLPEFEIGKEYEMMQAMKIEGVKIFRVKREEDNRDWIVDASRFVELG